MIIIKTMKQILASLVHTTVTEDDRITDFTPGSAIRTLYNSIALQLEEFYYAMNSNIKYMIENSLYLAFGFQLLPATYAQGHLEIEFKDPLVVDFFVPKGTEFISHKNSYKGIVYTTQENKIIPKHSRKYILPVVSKIPGSKQNVPADTITLKSVNDPRILSITNPKALSGGSDKETYDQRVSRFKRFIATLTRATKGALEYAAYSVPGVTGVFIEDSRAGLVKLYCHDSSGELNDEMKAKVKQAIEDVRAAGVEVLIVPVDKKGISIEIKISVFKGKDINVYKNLVKLYLDNWIRNLPVGYTLTLAELYQVIMNSYDDSIENCIILKPTEDIKGSSSSVIIPEVMEVGEINA